MARSAGRRRSASSPPAAPAALRWWRRACAACRSACRRCMISSIASGDVGPYVGPSDITMMYSVTDVQGLNSISRQVLANGANAMVGMAKARLATAANAREASAEPARRRPDHVRRHHAGGAAHQRGLRDDFECLVFHATGVGGRSMEKLVDSGLIAGVIDLTTTEVADMLMGGVLPGDRRPLRRDHPHPHPLRRLGRRARHGQFRRRAKRCPSATRPQTARPQSASDADAHHGGRERAHRPLDRRAAQPAWTGRCASSCPNAASPRSTRRDSRSWIPRPTRRCSARSSRRSARPPTGSSSGSSRNINDPEFASAVVAAFRSLMGRGGARRRASR